MEYLARQGLKSKSILASTKSPSLAADTSLSPEAEQPKELPIITTHKKETQKTNFEGKKWSLDWGNNVRWRNKEGKAVNEWKFETLAIGYIREEEKLDFYFLFFVFLVGKLRKTLTWKNIYDVVDVVACRVFCCVKCVLWIWWEGSGRRRKWMTLPSLLLY